MRIAFYAPMKPPTHPVPSGDRRMARALMAALSVAGHEVTLASEFRAYEGAGDGVRQAEIRAAGTVEAARLIMGPRFDAWFTYHLYHKAPDWLGPAVSRALAVPYVVAEASHAAKQAAGPWAAGHAAAAGAIATADMVLAMTANDREGLAGLVGDPARLRALPPFLDARPLAAARAERDHHRAVLAARHGLDSARPWALTVAMMRPGAKLASYRLLGAALAGLPEGAAEVIAIGDGPARADVLAAMPALSHPLGEVSEEALAAWYGAADLLVWPAVDEAYGMALLEAQAAGLPVVAGAAPGVAEMVADGGVIVPPGDVAAFTAAVAGLLGEPERRRRLGAAAARRVAAHHDLAAGARALSAALAAVRRR